MNQFVIKQLNGIRVLHGLLCNGNSGRVRKEFIVLGFLSGYTGLFTSLNDVKTEAETIKKFYAIAKYFHHLTEVIIQREASPFVVNVIEYARKLWRLHVYRNCVENNSKVKVSDIAASIALGVHVYNRYFRDNEIAEVIRIQMKPGA